MKGIRENIESEILDIILCETADVHPLENVFEIDTTGKSVGAVTSAVMEIINNLFPQLVFVVARINLWYHHYFPEMLVVVEFH